MLKLRSTCERWSYDSISMTQHSTGSGVTGRTWCFSYGAQALKAGALLIGIALQSCHIKVPSAYTTNVCLLHTSMTSAKQKASSAIRAKQARWGSHNANQTPASTRVMLKGIGPCRSCSKMLHMTLGSVTDLRLSHFSKVVFLRAIGSLALAHELDTVHDRWQVAQQVLHQVAGLVSSL